MAQYGLNLRIAYTWGVKKSVGRVVKKDITNLSLLPPGSDQTRDDLNRSGQQKRSHQQNSDTQ